MTARPPETDARALDPHTGEPIVELQPAPRVIGPGRRERAYLARQAELERELERSARELELSALVERGSVRAASKLETRLASAEEQRARLQAAQNRLVLALGALQRENELLRESLKLTDGTMARAALPPAPAAPAPAKRRSAWWRRRS